MAIPTPFPLERLMLRRLLPLIAPLALSAAVCADTPPPTSTDPFATADWLSSARIEGLKALPISGLQMVQAGGRTFLMSSNGRFVITGTLLDVWNRVAVTDLAQVDAIANRIDLRKLKLKLADLGPIQVGHGKETVLVFVDPRCPYCKQLQQQMEPLSERYTFQLVPVPVLGPDSQALVMKLGCLAQTEAKDQARTALLQQTYDTLPATLDPGCDREPMQRALVTAHLFGVEAVPFLIAPDGRTHKGAPARLADWLAAVEPSANASLKPLDNTAATGAAPDGHRVAPKPARAPAAEVKP